jgi:hypothetical protein
MTSVVDHDVTGAVDGTRNDGTDAQATCESTRYRDDSRANVETERDADFRAVRVADVTHSAAEVLKLRKGYATAIGEL